MRCKSLEDETLCAIACTTVGVTVTLQCCADVLRYVPVPLEGISLTS